jgi:hypothetical protein
MKSGKLKRTAVVETRNAHRILEETRTENGKE